MSHDIVKHRFALTFAAPEPRPGWSALDYYCLFAEFASANNVDPRTYEGEIRCVDRSLDPRTLTNPSLPRALWEEGYLAEGGMLKAYPGRDVSGTGWISGWQKIARRPIPIADASGNLLVRFHLVLWISTDQAAAYLAGARPEWRYRNEAAAAAWELLIQPELARREGHYPRNSIYLTTTTHLAAALELLHQQPVNDSPAIREHERMSIHLTLSESTGDSLAEMFAATPEPQSATPKPAVAFRAGMVIELYGHRYRLLDKRKSTWLAEKDGRTYRIGPKHFAAAAIAA
jgi:hypothetical protein